MKTKDPYKVLRLSRGASQEDIRKAHRQLVRQYHPDANPEDPQSEERFKEIQQAYEALSNEKKRREYEEGLGTSPRESSGRPRSRESTSKPRTRAGGRTAEGTTHTVDLSGLLTKLTNLSSDGGRKGGSDELGDEEVAHLAKLLGEKISPLLEVLGKDPVRLSKLLGDNIKTNAKVSFGDVRSGKFSATDENISREEPSATSNEPREKKVKSPGARRREERVKVSRRRGKGRSS